MKTDRELLELAAKAIGLTLRYNYLGGRDANQQWDPLEDDGDALRLAVKLNFDIQFYWNGCDDQYDEVCAYTHGAKKDASEQIGFYLNGGQIDEFAAARRAIVRAAAAIGESMRD